MDTKAVHLILNSPRSVGTISTGRRQKGSTDKAIIAVPEIVKEYNKYMGGVDLADQLKSYYAVDIRCRYKYYLRVVFDSLDTTVVNGYLNYKSLNPGTEVTHLEFRQQVVHGLLGTYTSRKNTSPTGSIKRKAWSSSPHYAWQKEVQTMPQERHGESIKICVCHLWGCFVLAKWS